MSLRKQYLTRRPVCRVTFTIPKESVGASESASLVGDFNNWDSSKTPMEKLKNGKFTITIELDQGKEYQFRYVLDGNNWINDEKADKYVVVPDMNTENSVVEVEVLEA